MVPEGLARVPVGLLSYNGHLGPFSYLYGQLLEGVQQGTIVICPMFWKYSSYCLDRGWTRQGRGERWWR